MEGRGCLLLMAACLVCLLSPTTAAEGASWEYTGSAAPEYWGDNYPLCKGRKQSPINIDPKTSMYTGLLQLHPLKLIRYDEFIPGNNLYVINNGHSVTVKVGDDLKHEISVTGGGLPSRYILSQFHWHWGSENGFGSEHTFGGKQYPMELHFVHVNHLYKDDATVLGSQDGLAVLGVFVEVGEFNPAFEEVIQLFAAANLPEANATSVKVNLTSLRSFLPQDLSRFYRYEGSLTTPPCYEAVIWTVLRDTIQISQEQLNKFRTELKKDRSANRTPSSTNLIVNNYRPVQPLNGRTVYASYSNETDGILDVDMLNYKKWGYYTQHGKSLSPSDWGKNYRQCQGSRQSPIHIRHSEALRSPQISESPWKLTNYDQVPKNFVAAMKNNGHTVVIEVGDGVTVSGGGLPSEFRLLQFHWHWGRHNANGSEHILDGNQYPAELHLVHTNMDYGRGKDIKQIEANSDGLAVLGVFIEVGDHNPAFDAILVELKKVKYASDTNNVRLDLKSLRDFLPEDMSEFYRYHGSLTTPPCWEIVIWTVFKNTIKISQQQLDHFRTKVLNVASPNRTEQDILLGGESGNSQPPSTTTPSSQGNSGSSGSSDSGATEYLLDNFRPVQNLNYRVVKYAKIQTSDTVGKAVRTGSLSVVCLLVCLAILGFVRH